MGVLDKEPFRPPAQMGAACFLYPSQVLPHLLEAGPAQTLGGLQWQECPGFPSGGSGKARVWAIPCYLPAGRFFLQLAGLSSLELSFLRPAALVGS